MSFQAKDSTVTFNWVIAPNASPPVKADFDITLVLPSGVTTYTNDGITTYVAPTATVQGSATFDLTLAQTGLYQVTLSTGTAAVHILSAHREVYSVVVPTHVLNGASAQTVRGPRFLPIIPGAPAGASGTSGESWTERNSPVNIDLNDVIYIPRLKRWVGVGGSFNSAPLALTSDDGGITWIERTVPINKDLNGLHYSEGARLIVAVGFRDGTRSLIATSRDGIKWDAQTTPANNVVLNDVAYGLGVFVTVGNAFNSLPYALWDANGLHGCNTWAVGDTTGLTSGTMNAVAFSPELGQFVAIGNNVGMRSTDGKVWIDITGTLPFTNATMKSIIWDGTQYIAVGTQSFNAEVWTSPDGIAWTVITTTGDLSNANLERIEVGIHAGDGVCAPRKIYIIAGQNEGGMAWKSFDLIQWDLHLNVNSTLNGVDWSSEEDQWVVVGVRDSINDDTGIYTAP